MTLSSNVSSMMTNQNYMNQSAQRVANLNTDQATTDLSKEMNDQMMIEKNFQSNAVAIKTADELLGSLIDLRA